MKYSLQNRDGMFYVVISYKDDNGKFKQKWKTTKIPAQKGNRHLADQAAEEIYINWLTERKEAKDVFIPDKQERYFITLCKTVGDLET